MSRVLRNLNFGLGIYLAGLAGVLAAGMLGLQPTIGSSLIMPSFVAIIIGGLGSLPGTLLGGLLIGVASGVTTVFFPGASEAVIYVMMAAVSCWSGRAAVGRGGALLMEPAQVREPANVVVWLLLLTTPYWLPLIGGYTSSSAAASWCWRSPRWRSIFCSASPACCRSATPPISASAPTAPA